MTAASAPETGAPGIIMTGLAPKFRHERKFLAPGLSLAEALAVARRHPAAFRETYPARAVNSLYLDSLARGDYFAHVNGAPDRNKTRIRWYGQLTGHIERPSLERKLKRGSVSGKAACPLPAIHVNGGIAPADLAAALDQAGLPAELRWTLRLLEPAVLVAYHRHYFQSADGCFRLTLDSQLQFWSVHPGTGAMALMPAAAHPMILELKFDPLHAAEAAPLTNALPFRLARCSKYVLGIECLLATPPAVSPEQP
jgi:hypothetical protein